MGLLSKAASGALNHEEQSHGGLLKLITEKQQTKDADIPMDTADKNRAPSSPLEKAVMEKLYAGYAKFGIFQGIIIEALKYSAGEFAGRLAFMVSGFGTAQGLAPGRALVLFNSVQDGELISKHLAKTVPGKSIFKFMANTPQEAFSIVRPYL